MICTSKVDIYDRYSDEREVTVIQNIGSPDMFGAQKTKISYKKEKRKYCSVGDELKIITHNAGEWCGAVVVENKNGERFAINWNNLNIKSELDD
jgi:hypothetical protein